MPDNHLGIYLWMTTVLILVLTLGTPKFTGNAFGTLVNAFYETRYTGTFTLVHPSYFETLENIDGNAQTEW